MRNTFVSGLGDGPKFDEGSGLDIGGGNELVTGSFDDSLLVDIASGWWVTPKVDG